MRCLSTPGFNWKLRAIANDDRAVSSVRSMVVTLESDTKEMLLSGRSRLRVEPLDGSIYVARSDGVQIFFSVGTDAEGEYLLLLDILDTSGTLTVGNTGARDPRKDGHLNPYVNGMINPNVNGMVNPNVNGMVNPNVNGMINPNVNGMINPNVNGMINPNVNGMINPNVNMALNPKYNATINPRYNRLFGGPFIYNLELNPEGYLIRANENVELMFSIEGDFIGLAVRNGSDGCTVFDTKLVWTGYFVDDKQGGYLRFERSGAWLGLVV